MGLFFICLGEKTWSWENFLKKNKKNSTLIREFTVLKIKYDPNIYGQNLETPDLVAK